MNRRETVLALLALGASPLTCSAQQANRTYRIGVFLGGREPAMRRYLDVLRERLARHAFVEGQNLQIVLRLGIYDRDVDQAAARALLASAPDALFIFTSILTLTVQSLHAQVPIVFTFVGDPVGYGLVKELRRPGGNATGASTQQRGIKLKRLELLRDLLPHAKRVGLVGYSGATGDLLYHANEAALREAAGRLGLELLMEPGWSGFAGGYVPAMETAALRGAEAFYIFHPLAVTGLLFGGEDVVRFANERRIPAIFEESELVDMGGLLSYGASLVDEVRRSAEQLARVLKGANAGDLPVDLASRFELVVNMRTAKALGLTIPQSVLLRADRVIE